MNNTRNVILLAVIMIMGLWTTLELRLYGNPSGVSKAGPDVIVGDIPNILRFGTADSKTAYSIATTSCNIGDVQLDWQANTKLHPVITQNLYRVKDGRIEQIGMSWLKHGFSVAAGFLCGDCQDFSTTLLAVNCSDPYSAGLNGFQSGLGPRSEVNAATGDFVFPFRRLPQPRTVLDGRISVSNADLDPSQNVGARYFVESQYVHPQDAAAGNQLNNASYREAFVSVGAGGEFELSTQAVATTVREKPGIRAWKSLHPDVQILTVDVANDGRFLVGIRTTKKEAGGFHTELAVQNLTSHRSMRSIGLKFASPEISNPGFSDIDYHHEPYFGDDWANSITANTITWSTEEFATNENANALRWGTLYSYWCDSESQPSQFTLGLFRPGATIDIAVAIPVVAPLREHANARWATVESSANVGTIKNDESATFPIACRADLVRTIGVESSNKSVMVTAKENKSKSKNRSWDIVVIPAEDATDGYFESIVTVKTKNEKDRPIQVRIFGNIQKQE